MPIHLPPLSRRRFLAGSLAAAAAGAYPALLAADDDNPVDPHSLALLADTHINLNPETAVNGIKMTEHFTRVAKQLIAMKKRPAATIINGDCAHLVGRAGDYQALAQLLKPMREAGLGVSLTLGNHDHRDNFWNVVEPELKIEEKRAMKDKHVALMKLPRANLLLLDSLNIVNKTPGLLGEAQLKWLAETLDAHAGTPAVVIAHHSLEKSNPQTKYALIDTDAMLDVLLPRKQAKAYVFGHSHNWQVSQEQGLHLINLPPVAYVFDKKRPSGWVDAALSEKGATLTLHALDESHTEHGQKLKLTWR